MYLPKDPLDLYKKEIWKIKDNIGYFSTDHFHYYGIVNSGQIKIVIGPTQQISDNDQELRELAFRMDIPRDDTEDFVAGMKSIIQMPLESILQMLCTINHVLNGETLALEDITIYDTEQEELKQIIEHQRIAEKLDSSSDKPSGSHNTFYLEQKLMSIVRKGDLAALNEWIASAPAVRGGVLAGEQIRHIKNTFIVTATITSREAIRGGMDIGDAFTLSDSYIQKCELFTSPEKIINLQYRMIMDFTERVSELRNGKRPTSLTLDVANYIQHHMSETITVDAIAKEMYLSRPYLSRKFKNEAGITLTDFILKEKIEEAKRLLRYSDKSITAIGAYLGFSSQSHFSRVFRKYAGKSPAEYRDKYF